MTMMSDKLAAEIIPGATNLPKEVEFLLSALEAGLYATSNRRHHERRPYRVIASLRLYSNPADAPPSELFTRDVSPRGVGFITPHRLPLGYGGILSILTPQGKTLRIDCTIVRCRQAAPGWFEGSMYFNRPQAAFESTGPTGWA